MLVTTLCELSQSWMLAVQNRREGTMAHAGQNTRGGPEAFTSGGIEGRANAAADLKIWGDHQHPTLGDLKRQRDHEAGLSAAHRHLKMTCSELFPKC